MAGVPEGFEVSSDPLRLDVGFVHGYLCEESYWARGIPRALVERAIAHSLCFGLYEIGGAQVGFARLITDQVTLAWLADVFVLEKFRGRGLGKALVGTALAHPDIAEVRRRMLSTADAHRLYGQFGFAALHRPDKLMELVRHNPYGAGDISPVQRGRTG